MPAYGSAPVQTLSSGFPTTVWNDEIVATSGNGALSLSACMKRNPNLPNAVSVEVSFAADPGAFAIDLQVADTDIDKYYVTKATLNTGLNAGFVGRIEATNIVAKFIRLKLVSRANSVKCTAKLF